MNLSYRGVSYEYKSPTMDVREEVFSTYSGQPCRLGYVRHIPTAPLTTNRVVCGNVDYTARVADRPVAKLTEVEIRQRVFPNDRGSEKILDEAKNAHITSIKRSLERRLQAAKAKGDELLLNLLQAEIEEMAIN